MMGTLPAPIDGKACCVLLITDNVVVKSSPDPERVLDVIGNPQI